MVRELCSRRGDDHTKNILQNRVVYLRQVLASGGETFLQLSECNTLREVAPDTVPGSSFESVEYSYLMPILCQLTAVASWFIGRESEFRGKFRAINAASRRRTNRL
jgi:hypothetical protein